jgi:hypothetical protein
VADDLRRRTSTLVLDMPLEARIDLALALGDDDLDLFVRVSGLDRDEARRRDPARPRCAVLTRHQIPHALIGAAALAARGVAPIDLRPRSAHN